MANLKAVANRTEFWELWSIQSDGKPQVDLGNASVTVGLSYQSLGRHPPMTPRLSFIANTYS